jgi:hypothetical protein
LAKEYDECVNTKKKAVDTLLEDIPEESEENYPYSTTQREQFEEQLSKQDN